MNHRSVITAFSLIICFLTTVSAHASKSDIGLTCDKEIVGVNRYIEVGNTISYTVEYLEQNKYRCSEFQGKVRELVSCSYRLDHRPDNYYPTDDQTDREHRLEILLTVEEGTVTEIETRSSGVECN